jgi:succinate-semialdehyde dehydrogenase/glutarate-semialdehyde dehydrogenase
MSDTTMNATDVLSHIPTGLLIGGEWRPAQGNRPSDVCDPAVSTALLTVADATAEDGIAALLPR